MTTKKSISTSLIFLLIIVVLFLSFTSLYKDNKPNKAKSFRVRISFAGDIMVHTPQYEAAFNEKKGEYNFNENYREIKKYIKLSDLAICNLETVIGNEPYSGFPRFNSPKALCTALKKAGFHMTVNANNHSLDQGIMGILDTVKTCRKSGLKTSGCRLDNEERFTIVKVKGVNIGIVAYTYERPSKENLHNLNKIPMNDKALYSINSFRYKKLPYKEVDSELIKIKTTINDAKKAGADIVVTVLHWGREYRRTPEPVQQYISKELTRFGTDVIFGSHPHVTRPMEFIPKKYHPNATHNVPVFYSMGNFISDQREERLHNRFIEQGGIAYADIVIKNLPIEKNKKPSKKIIKVTPHIMPVWTDKYTTKSGRNKYVIVPLNDAPEKSPALKASGHLSSAQRAKKDAVEQFGEDLFILK